jgi:hypothetical protein
MADFTKNFDNAPNGNMRQFGVLAGALDLKYGSRFRSSGGKSLSARDQAALAKQNAIHQAILSGQNHTQNLEMESHKANLGIVGDVAKHVMGTEASKQEHKQTLSKSRQQAKIDAAKTTQQADIDAQKDYTSRLFTSTEAAADRKHAASENSKNRSAATKAAKDPNVRSLNATTGTVTTTHPMQKSQQFNGVGEEDVGEE